MEVLKDYDNADTISVDTVLILEWEKNLREETEALNARLRSLSKTVRYFHTSLLFFRGTGLKTNRHDNTPLPHHRDNLGTICHEAYKTMVMHMNSSENTWRYVGGALGFKQTELDYIKNSPTYDPAVTILKIFAQNDGGTLEKILDAFVKLSKYDTLLALEKPLTDMVLAYNEDSGYQSCARPSNAIISYITEELNDVPPAFKKYTKHKEPNQPKVPVLRLSTKIENVKRNDQPFVLLTYADDGLATAYKVKQYVENWTDMPEVTVLSLDDKKEEVSQDPVTKIKEYLEEAVLVIPIITRKYLEVISSQETVPTAPGYLDFQYVKFIYNLIVNTYIHRDGCSNKKVRSVLPLDCPVDVRRSASLYSELSWTSESNFDKYFKVFLKSRLANKS